AVEREARRFLALDGAVEDLARGELAFVVHLDHVFGLRRLAGAGLELAVHEARGGLGRALLGGGLREVGRAGLLLLLGRGFHARLVEFLQLRQHRVHFIGLELARVTDAVGEAGLHHLQFLGGEREALQVAAGGDTQGIQGLFLIRLRRGHWRGGLRAGRETGDGGEGEQSVQAHAYSGWEKEHAVYRTRGRG